MMLPVPLRFSNRERYAIYVAIALLLVGLWLGVKVQSDWLSRFGALVIIVGVIFAVSDLPGVLEEQARNRAKIVLALTNNQQIDRLAKDSNLALTPTQREALHKHMEPLNKEYVERQASIPRRRFFIVEAAIVCVGTFFNGFGQWIATLLQG